MRPTLLTAAALFGLAALPALAEDGPWVRLDLTAEAEADWTPASTDPAAELIDVYPYLEASAEAGFGNGLTIFGTVILEPVLDPTGDRVFDDLGLYVDTLGAAWDFGSFKVFGGKVAAPFGIAWDAAPGLYGTTFAEDYEIAGVLGAGVEIPFAALGGSHAFTATLFTADRTILSDSLFTRVGRTRLSDGGAGNTEAPESAALNLAGTWGTEEDGWGYVLSARRLAEGQGDAGDDLGLSAGLTRTLPMGESSLTLLGELAFFDNFGGGADAALYATLGAAWTTGDWTFSASATLREAGTTDALLSLGVDYALTEEIYLGAGYSLIREAGETSHTVGILIGWGTCFGRCG